MIEVKGRKGDLIKTTENGDVDNFNKKGEPNYTNIAKYAVNGAVHYAHAILNFTETFKEVVAVGVNGYDDSGKMDSGNVRHKSFHVTDDVHKGIIDGVFVVKNSHNILQSSIIPNSGSTPYVTAGEGNNSISTYISYDNSQIEKGNAIMIGGKTMVITYQSDDFFSNDSHNLVLYVKDPCLATKLVQLYMVASLNKSLIPIYSWGDSISSKKIRKDSFHLPVTSSGEIDYHFMETYIRALEKQTIQRVKDWRAKEIAAANNIVNR